LTDSAESPSRKAPVLCLAFNRPDLFRQVIAAIAEGGPRELYISIDGPRRNHSEDPSLCEEVRELASAIDWATHVKLKIEDENLGVRRAVESAISWALSTSTEIIVLEDDCLPDPSFFAFCDELLARYRDDERVMQISGTNWGAAPDRFAGFSYAFTSFAPVWGWATWRRAWNLYDQELESWPRARSTGLIDGMSVSRRFRRLLQRDWDRVRSSGGEWDRNWQYSVLLHHGLSACPARNLVRNIGLRPDATHLTGSDRIFSNLPVDKLSFPLKHPPEVARNADAEAVFERVFWQKLGWPAQAFAWLVRNPRLNRMIRAAWRNVLPRPS
jgi:hypothetical protein